MFQSLPIAVRLITGAALGASAWLLARVVLPFLPIPARFILGWLLFTFGPGAAVAGRLTRDIDPWRRVIVLLGVGSAATPVLIVVLGRAHLLPAFPYVAAALAGAGLAGWRLGSDERAAPTPRADIAAYLALLALALGLGAIVFLHRLVMTGDNILLFGDYDSADLSWYAAVASEASHTVPPMASYYAGHQLNAAYYCHLVPAMIHRFCAVPVLSIYFRYGWPTFVALGALTAFTLVRSIASRSVAVLAVVLILVGSDVSYLAAWFLPHAAIDWDYLLWPTNFLSPTMQVMHFSTWSPSLPVYFTALFAIVRGLQTRSRSWLVLSGFLIGILFEFKPFAWVILMAALSAAAVFAGGDAAARTRFAATAGLGVLFSLPFIWGAATLDPGDRRTRLVIDYAMLPRRMLIKIDLTDAFAHAAARLAPWTPLRYPLFLAMATVVFLAVGIGVRWLGAAGVWRAIRAKGGGENQAAWRLLAWGVAAGIAVPFVLTTDPYVDTLQFYLAGLYLMWIFAAAALVASARENPKAGALAIALALALALPSSVHYLHWKWTDQQRAPRVGMTRNELAIADYLRSSDPETTVILHDRPLSPSLMAIVTARRIVLGWDVRYSAVGGEGRLREVNRFYSSAGGNPDAALDVLRRYHVTHVIVRRQDDHVHATVLARLKVALQFSDVVLYEVPPL